MRFRETRVKLNINLYPAPAPAPTPVYCTRYIQLSGGVNMGAILDLKPNCGHKHKLLGTSIHWTRRKPAREGGQDRDRGTYGRGTISTSELGAKDKENPRPKLPGVRVRVGLNSTRSRKISYRKFIPFRKLLRKYENVVAPNYTTSRFNCPRRSSRKLDQKRNHNQILKRKTVHCF